MGTTYDAEEEAKLRGLYPAAFADHDAGVAEFNAAQAEAAKMNLISTLRYLGHPTTHALDAAAWTQRSREDAAQALIEMCGDPQADVECMVATLSEMWARDERNAAGSMRLDLAQVLERFEDLANRMETAQSGAEQNTQKMARLLDALGAQMSTPGQAVPPPQSADLQPPPGMPKMELALSSDERDRLAARYRTWAGVARTGLNSHVQSDLTSVLSASDDAATRCCKKRKAFAAFLGASGTNGYRESLKKLQTVPPLPAKCLPERPGLTKLQELVLGALELLCGEEAERWFKALDKESALRGIQSGLGADEFVAFIKRLAPNLQSALAVLYIAQRSANPGGSIVSNKSGEAGPGGCKGPNYTGAAGRHPACRVLRHYGAWLDEHAAHARKTDCPLSEEEATIRVRAVFERPRACRPLERARRLRLLLSLASRP